MAPLLFAAASARASTITVNSTADTAANDGVCTLREAITAANTNTASGAAAGECAAGQASPTVDTIAFNIPGAGVHTITPASSLPLIVETVFIDGYSQPGSSANTLTVGDNAMLLIEIDGTNSSLGGLHLFTSASNGSTIRGLVISHVAGTAISIEGSSNNAITGNFIGTDPAGTTASASSQSIDVTGVSTGNVIGGTTPAARNVMTSTQQTIHLFSATNTTIQGNYIGIDKNGTSALGTAFDGIFLIVGASNNLIGGTSAGAGNVIGFFTGHGIREDFGGNNNNTIQGNLIGTNAAGTIGLASQGFGMQVDDGLVGGTTAGAGNLVSGVQFGILVAGGNNSVVIQGNKIGTDITGALPLGNAGSGICVSGFTTNLTGTIGGTAAGAANRIAFNGAQGVQLEAQTGWSILGNSIDSNGGLGISLAPGSGSNFCCSF